MKHWGMSGVIIPTIHHTRRNNLNRHLRIKPVHSPSLHRRSVRTQQTLCVDIERILHITGRMVSRQVHSLKVVVIQLHLWPLGNGVTHTQKYFLKFIHHQSQRMFAAQLQGLPRQSNIHRLLSQLRLQSLVGQLLLSASQILLQSLA